LNVVENLDDDYDYQVYYIDDDVDDDDNDDNLPVYLMLVP